MKKTFVIHPFLFAVFPTLFLFNHNIAQFPLSVIFIPLMIITCFVLLFRSLLKFVLKGKEKAGLLVSIFLLLLFSYGHFYAAMKSTFVEWYIGRNIALLPVWSTLFFLGAYFSIKTRKNLHNFTKLLNIVAASLVAFSLINIGTYKLKTYFALRGNKNMENIETKSIDLKKVGMLPNIYYIILDAYARADVMKELYNYENTEFLDYLTKKGFYIANKSRANYAYTALSLGASLNFDYHSKLVDRIGTERDDIQPMANIIKNNMAVQFLKQYGYKFVAFGSGFAPTEIPNADVYYTTSELSVNEFQEGLMRTILPWYVIKPFSNNLLRKRILYAFDHLVDTTELESPIFVFAHILAPHGPFVFGPHGEEINLASDRKVYLKSYINEVIFINKKIKTMVDEILAKSTNPPIIILQADHGSDYLLKLVNPSDAYIKERLSILNAYYLPDSGSQYLYNEITPVNTFRIIFNHYFGANYELLKDESYFSFVGQPYKFINVTDKINADIR